MRKTNATYRRILRAGIDLLTEMSEADRRQLYPGLTDRWVRFARENLPEYPGNDKDHQTISEFAVLMEERRRDEWIHPDRLAHADGTTYTTEIRPNRLMVAVDLPEGLSMDMTKTEARKLQRDLEHAIATFADRHLDDSKGPSP